MTPTSAPDPTARAAGASDLQAGQATGPVRIWALIPAAGVGSRAGGNLPKQYQTVAGQPMVVHCLNAFAHVAQVAGTLVVLSPFDKYFYENIDYKSNENSPLFIANCGGNTRLESVLFGLEYFKNRYSEENDWIMVHDAARCLITAGQIQGLIDAVQDDAVGGLLALKVPDTLKAETDGRVAETVDRTDKWLAQTPQMFRAGMLLQALRQASAGASAGAGTGVTDESGAVEQLGLRPKLVQGSAQNFKVTYPEDFALADRVLRGRMAEAASHHQPAANGPNTNYDYP